MSSIKIDADLRPGPMARVDIKRDNRETCSMNPLQRNESCMVVMTLLLVTGIVAMVVCTGWAGRKKGTQLFLRESQPEPMSGT